MSGIVSMWIVQHHPPLIAGQKSLRVRHNPEIHPPLPQAGNKLKQQQILQAGWKRAD